MDIYKMREMKNAIRRIESTSKVTGTAQYLDDLEMQGMAYGGIIRSPYPHAKVLSIDFSEVKKMHAHAGRCSAGPLQRDRLFEKPLTDRRPVDPHLAPPA